MDYKEECLKLLQSVPQQFLKNVPCSHVGKVQTRSATMRVTLATAVKIACWLAVNVNKTQKNICWFSRSPEIQIGSFLVNMNFSLVLCRFFRHLPLVYRSQHELTILGKEGGTGNWNRGSRLIQEGLISSETVQGNHCFQTIAFLLW